MNTDMFAYWLQGALEMNPEMLKNGMTPEQVQTIQDHLNLVFTKVTPDRFKDKGEKVNHLEIDPFTMKPYDYTGNPPPTLPTTTSSDDGKKKRSMMEEARIAGSSPSTGPSFTPGVNDPRGDLFCSKYNLNSDLEENKNMWITGCTNSNLAEDLAVHMDGEKEEEWTGGSTLLRSC